MFPELRSSGKSVGNRPGSQEVLTGQPLEQLRSDQRFNELRSMLRSASGLGTGLDAIKQLERRGLVNTANENDLLSNIMRLAAGDEDEGVLDRIESRLKGLTSGGRISAIDDALNLNLVLTDLMSRAVREFGMNPSQQTITKVREWLVRAGLTNDKSAIDRLTVLAGLSERTDPNMLRGLLVRANPDYAYKGETGDMAKRAISELGEFRDKLAKAQKTSGSEGKPAAASVKEATVEIGEAEDAEIIRWLEDSGKLYEEVVELITDPDKLSFVKKHLKLNLEKKADRDEFLTRYFLRNVTTNKGERVFVNGEAVPAKDYADPAAFPVKDLVDFLAERKKNANAPIPENLRAHYLKVRSKIDPYSEKELDRKLGSADSLLRKVRSGLKISFATVEAFARRGIAKFPPSISDLKKLVEDFVEKRPSMKKKPSPLKYLLHYAGNEGQDESWLNEWDFTFTGTNDEGEPLKWPSADGTVAAMMRSPNPEEDFKEFLQDMISTDEIVGAAEMEETLLNEFLKYLNGEGEEDVNVADFAA